MSPAHRHKMIKNADYSAKYEAQCTLQKGYTTLYQNRIASKREDVFHDNPNAAPISNWLVR